MKIAICLTYAMLCLSATAQFGWIWEELPSMPEAISNNALSSATVGDDVYVYSFAGIDSSKTNEGISLRAMRYSLNEGTWDYIPDLPDTLGKIAAGASTVNNIIYIIGGYHVFDGPPYELSSDRIHRYDPESNSYLSDGAPLPYAIDDHVQAVWRDSLIYVITGWSDTQNVEHVQIYDPANDSWQLGDPVPTGIHYEAFGASGTIIGDTIYYFGGAIGATFNATGRLRKGVINPDDPTDISWSLLSFSPNDKGYRCAALAIDERAYWVGGSHITYNYDGIAYNGSGGVPPLNRILAYEPATELWHDMNWQPVGVMDLRGIAQVSDYEFIIAGGMLEGQQVSDKAYLLSYQGPSGLASLELDSFSCSPNPLGAGQDLIIDNRAMQSQEVMLHDAQGRCVQRLQVGPGRNIIPSEDLQLAVSGTYYLSSKGGGTAVLLFTALPR